MCSKGVVCPNRTVGENGMGGLVENGEEKPEEIV